jgi:hypothetical protein
MVMPKLADDDVEMAWCKFALDSLDVGLSPSSYDHHQKAIRQARVTARLACPGRMMIAKPNDP